MKLTYIAVVVWLFSTTLAAWGLWNERLPPLKHWPVGEDEWSATE